MTVAPASIPASIPVPTNGKKSRPVKKKSLVSKLAEVQASLDHLEKNAVADMGNFKFPYVEEQQVLEALRIELASRHIMIFPEITDIAKDGQFVTLRLMFHIRDGESGEIISSQWASHAADSRDFGVGKATTQAVKYYLLKTFLLPSWERPEDANGVKAKVPVAGDLENSANKDRVEEPRTPNKPLEQTRATTSTGSTGETSAESPDAFQAKITSLVSKQGPNWALFIVTFDARDAAGNAKEATFFKGNDTVELEETIKTLHQTQADAQFTRIYSVQSSTGKVLFDNKGNHKWTVIKAQAEELTVDQIPF
jgi:hypothetical protein